MERHYDVLVVGTGPAGTQTALGLITARYDGAVGLLGSEPQLPYERPPLSKAYLAGEMPDEGLLVRPAEFWDHCGIDLLRETTAVSVDPVGRHLRTANGQQLSYGSLVWAAGCRPRRLPIAGVTKSGVLSLRSWADARALRSRLAFGRRLVVVGGGYIGLEVAATASKLGVQVTVIEEQDRLLARVAGHMVADFLARKYQGAGVRLVFGARAKAIGGEVAVSGVELESGEVIEADTVLIGVGVEPNIEPLATAGAQCRDGVLVDRFCQTSLDNVFAAGDCARGNDATSLTAGLRIESIQNAGAHARSVVAALSGTTAPDPETPWFWSNVYDVRLRTAGLIAAGYDRCVVRGDPETEKFSVIYLKDRTVVAIETVNSPKDLAHGKSFVGHECGALEAALADTSTSLKQVFVSHIA